MKPHAGDALLFWGVLLDGATLDKASMHAGCPVLKGTKYTATKWIHAEAYDNGGSVRQLKPGECRWVGALSGTHVSSPKSKVVGRMTVLDSEWPFCGSNGFNY